MSQTTTKVLGEKVFDERPESGIAWAKGAIQSKALATDANSASSLRPVLDSLLSRGLELTGTVLGNVQLMDWRLGCLWIAAQRGFNDEFLNFFQYVDVADGSACARVIRERRAVVVEDVLRDLEYAPCRTIALESGYRAVQSTPLISSAGTFVGVLSTHFATPHRPSTEELLALREIAELTANAIILRRRLM